MIELRILAEGDGTGGSELIAGSENQRPLLRFSQRGYSHGRRAGEMQCYWLREGELVSHDVVTSKSWETKERNSLLECLESSTALPDFKPVMNI